MPESEPKLTPDQQVYQHLLSILKDPDIEDPNLIIPCKLRLIWYKAKLGIQTVNDSQEEETTFFNELKAKNYSLWVRYYSKDHQTRQSRSDLIRNEIFPEPDRHEINRKMVRGYNSPPSTRR